MGRKNRNNRRRTKRDKDTDLEYDRLVQLIELGVHIENIRIEQREQTYEPNPGVGQRLARSYGVV